MSHIDYSEDYMIVLTTVTAGDTHDGYCSGSESSKRILTPRKKTRFVTVPSDFKTSSKWKKMSDGSVLLCPSNPRVKAVIGDFPKRNGCIVIDGSGHCGCTTTEKVVCAKMIPKSMIGTV
jgi:hypothetical protein